MFACVFCTHYPLTFLFLNNVLMRRIQNVEDRIKNSTLAFGIAPTIECPALRFYPKQQSVQAEQHYHSTHND